MGHAICVCACLEKDVHNRHVTRVSSTEESTRPLAVNGIDICAVAHEGRHDVCASAVRGVHKSGVTLRQTAIVRQSNGSAAREEHLDSLIVPHGGCTHQPRLTQGIAHIHVRHCQDCVYEAIAQVRWIQTQIAVVLQHVLADDCRRSCRKFLNTCLVITQQSF